MSESPQHDQTAVRPEEPDAPASARFAPGALIADRFRIVAQLGHGGMGEVFRADDLKLGQSVALKFLRRDVAHDRGRLERLHAEVRIGRQVSHPNVCRLYDIFEFEDSPFLVMEYVDGEDLASLLRRIGRLPADKAIDIARDLSAGLAAAHDLGVMHRDLKPANVMIDGRGKARITDFGLAVTNDQGRGFAGTPAYMSPEQLRGEPATARSDIYALGLILFEIYTGKPAHEGSTLDEIRAKRTSSKTPSVSSLVRDIDPAVERVIARCLDADPNARPSSAHAVIASLPGGDPLAMAVAAGETPSPEMVAAAGVSGELRPLVAWSLFAASVAAIIALALVENRSMLYRLVRLPKSTEILQQHAQEIAERLGYPTPKSTGGEWVLDDDFLAYLRKQQRAVTNWNLRPGVVGYIARLSPRELRAWHPDARITADDPPLLEPGMINVLVDPDGHLIEFAAVPPDRVERGVAGKAPDWNALFTEAALDPRLFHVVPSVRSAPVDSDLRIAWDGTLPSAPGVPLHVEAAARGSAPVWFKVFGPWSQPRTIDNPATSSEIGLIVNLLLEVIPIAIGIVLAIGNLRRGRVDQRGAMRTAAFCFAIGALARLLRSDHVALDYEEWNSIQRSLGNALVLGGTAWILYIALEPYVRRKWPRLLIAWTRLISGRVRDPMVGRDVLIGALGGVVPLLLLHGMRVIPSALGLPNAPPMQAATSMFASPRHVLFFLLISAAEYTVLGIELVALLVFLRLLLRRKSLATFVLLLLLTLAFGGGAARAPLVIMITFMLLSAGTLTFVVTRYGLLALVIAGYFWGVLLNVTITLDTSTWYFGRSLLAIAVLVGIVLVGAVTSIGDKPLFGAPILDEA